MVVGIYKQTARDIMSKHVVTVRANDTIHFALMMMAEHDLSALPVVDPDGKCLGIITQRDIIAAIREKDVEDTERHALQAAGMVYFTDVALEELTTERVQEMMSAEVVHVGPNHTATEIADRMLERGIHHVPVIDGDSTLLGIVSTMDILSGLRGPIEV